MYRLTLPPRGKIKHVPNLYGNLPSPPLQGAEGSVTSRARTLFESVPLLPKLGLTRGTCAKTIIGIVLAQTVFFRLGLGYRLFHVALACVDLRLDNAHFFFVSHGLVVGLGFLFAHGHDVPGQGCRDTTPGIP